MQLINRKHKQFNESIPQHIKKSEMKWNYINYIKVSTRMLNIPAFSNAGTHITIYDDNF